jgi:alpha-tubulin suppressor-like RCC1 family protein
MNVIINLFILIIFSSCNVISTVTNSKTKIDGKFLENTNNNTSYNSIPTYNLAATGSTSYGEYGGGQSTFIDNHLSSNSVVVSNQTFTKVVADIGSSCALGTNSKVYCWGSGSYGLGSGITTNQTLATPTEISGGMNFSDISGVDGHRCGITTGGALYCWGFNSSGQLGQGNNTQSAVPVQVGANTNWTKISVAMNVTCAINSANDLYCWGENSDGQLGLGDTTDRNIPNQVTGLWQEISNSVNSSCAIKTDNSLHCWGNNMSYQTGTGGNQADLTSPTAVNTSKTWVSISVGSGMSCAIDNLDDLYCAGNATKGEFGSYVDGSAVLRNTHTEIFPGTDWATVQKSSWAICATDTTNKLYCWARNYFGMLGLGTTTFLYDSPQEITGRSYSDYSLGNTHMCAIGTSDQKLYCWGSGYNGTIANGIDYSLNSSFVEYTPPVEFDRIESGREYSCGIDQDQKLYCWGRNDKGQLGIGSKDIKITPQEILVGKKWLDLSVTFYTTCAVTTENELYCWGYNSNGQFGNGSTTASLTPVKLSVSDDWLKVATSPRGYTCAVKTSGELYCWGTNSSKQLGQNNTSSSTTPLQVQTDTGWIDVAIAYDTTCALKATGDIYCFGEGNQGSIGNGGTTDQGLPTQIAYAANFTSLVERNKGFCALTNANQIICWGQGQYGQIGDGATTTRTTPVIINSGETFKSVHSGTHAEGACGITTSDDVFCWGRATSGQIGDGTTTNKFTPVQVGSGKIWTNMAVGNGFSIGIIKKN